MPLLSIVVPAHNVQAYVGDCLDSLLRQSVSDFELIAVDDCSTDHSGQILDEYAERDGRVRVLHLPGNAGMGGARNAALAVANGDYLWCVDSDDWVADGALATIAEHLHRLRPDVLMLNHRCAHWDGRTTPAGQHEILAAAPDVFTAVDYPEIVTVFPSVWNKVVRRAVVTDLGLDFPDGYYEDVPFSLPLVAAVDRIAVCDRVCYYYRQRRGSVLASTGARHLALVEQYRRVFERLRRLGGRAEALAPAVYRHMVWHLFVLLGSGRMAGRTRREYFDAASALCRRLRPESVTAPGGADGLRFRSLLRGSWTMVVALRGGYRALGAVRGRARRLLGAGRRLARLGRKVALRGYYHMQARLPVDEHLALYCANWGRGYLCNPAAIHAKARQLAPQVRGVFAVRAEAVHTLPEGVPHVVLDTAPFFRALARAKYLVNNNNFGNYYRKRTGSVFLQTHHGTPLKTMGVDERAPDGGRLDGDTLRALLRRCDNWDHDLSSNVYSSTVWQRAYPCGFDTLEYGYPRNDVLVDAGPEAVAAARAALGIGADERVVLYAPTYRAQHDRYLPLLDPAELVAALGPGHRLLVRAHYFYDTAELPGASARVLDVSDHPSVEQLYLAADVLVTDYSSAMFDYALLDRPIAIYAPDWAAYRAVRGVYFDLSAEPPGLFTTDRHELVAALCDGTVDAPEHAERRARFRRRFCTFDDGHAAERCVRTLMLGEPARPADPVGCPEAARPV